ncbi:MAG: hypothetical protein LUG95_06565 [Clostridiales bacterium]|nr:hypothetical protein [Clostridiales bacterium]
MKSIIPVTSGSDYILVKKSSEDFTYEYNIKKEITAPVYEGDILGEITVKCGEEKLVSLLLVAPVAIDAATFSYIFFVLLGNL